MRKASAHGVCKTAHGHGRRRVAKERAAMFLDYLPLAILVAVIVIVFHGVIAVHDIPHAIAKRNDFDFSAVRE